MHVVLISMHARLSVPVLAMVSSGVHWHNVCLERTAYHIHVPQGCYMYVLAIIAGT
jgi:hypothetical protein